MAGCMYSVACKKIVAEDFECRLQKPRHIEAE